jgi:hypothetical protein
VETEEYRLAAALTARGEDPIDQVLDVRGGEFLQGKRAESITGGLQAVTVRARRVG